MTSDQNIRGWCEIVIKIWEKKIIDLDIQGSYALAHSFAFHIVNHSGGDLTRIEFAFNYYGVFVDMGVGRGVKLEDRFTAANRKPKPWYTQTFLREVRKLAQLVAKWYAGKAAIVVAESMNLKKI